MEIYFGKWKMNLSGIFIRLGICWGIADVARWLLLVAMFMLMDSNCGDNDAFQMYPKKHNWHVNIARTLTGSIPPHTCHPHNPSWITSCTTQPFNNQHILSRNKFKPTQSFSLSLFLHKLENMRWLTSACRQIATSAERVKVYHVLATQWLWFQPHVST